MKTKHLLIAFLCLFSGLIQAQNRPNWDENTRKMLVENMKITGIYTDDVKKQNAMLDTIVARMYNVLGQDKEGNSITYKTNVYYDKAMVEKRQRLNAKFNDYIVVVEINRGTTPPMIKSPLEPDRDLVSALGIVDWTLKPTYELYAPTNKQIAVAIKNRAKDPQTYNWLQSGGLLMRKVSAATKKKIPQYSKK